MRAQLQRLGLGLTTLGLAALVLAASGSATHAGPVYLGDENLSNSMTSIRAITNQPAFYATNEWGNGIASISYAPVGVGVYGIHQATSGSAAGVRGDTASTASDARGVEGVVTSQAAGGRSAGVVGVHNAIGYDGIGVYGTHMGSGTGVLGEVLSDGNGVTGNAGAGGVGVQGSAGSFGNGVEGRVFGTNATAGSFQALGATSSTGIYAEGSANAAILNGHVLVTGNQSFGIVTRQMLNLLQTSYGIGVQDFTLYNRSGSGFAWYQGGSHSDVQGDPGAGGTTQMRLDGSGNLYVTGTVNGSAKNFRIDHPLDPARKYLQHASVESPDMLNVYSGNVVTDAAGLALVRLPGYFQALNRDFRYQLTPIGQFAQAIVAREIARNRFTIRTDKPGVKVSWQVTGVRKDAWANAHRTQVELRKPAREQGRYLHPELYGKPKPAAVGTGR
jgi:hypothetical protein